MEDGILSKGDGMKAAHDSQITRNPLYSAPLMPLIAKYAVPSIVSMLVSAAYNITDQAFIGHVVGLVGNAATSAAFPVVTLTTAFALLIGNGMAAAYTMAIGAGKRGEAAHIVGTGTFMLALAGVLVFTTIVGLKQPILILCGATKTVMPTASLYLKYTAFGLPMLLFANAGASLMRADGSPNAAMAASVSGAVLNVVLDAVFMFGLHLGIRGAALATVIGQGVSFLCCLFYYPRFKCIRFKLSSVAYRPETAAQIAKLGTANFINHIIMALVNIVLNNQLTRYGALSPYGSDIPLAVAGVVAKLNVILAAFAVGLAQGCQPVVSFNMGAQNYPRVKGAYLTAVRAAVIVSIIAFAVFQIFPRQIAGLFSTGSAAYFDFAEKYLRIYMFMIFVYGVQPMTVNYLANIGCVAKGITLSVARQGFFLIPLLVFLPRLLGIDGVLFAGPAADALAFALSVVLMRKNFRELDQMAAESGKTL
ncbi:MATE family efflux transporter [Pseudoramibacter porci]|nr:MATE family efflux transporter [Pseudoramibacter porci]